MTSFIETLNHWGEQFLNLAWPMLWQSSLLIAIIFLLDLAFRRKIRAAIRYALWLLVLMKLLLPPSLALPTSFAWWLLPSPLSPAKPQPAAYVVTYGDQTAPAFPPQNFLVPAPIQPKMSSAAWSLAASGVVSAGLLAWLLVRWLQINQKVRSAKTSEKLIPIFNEARLLAHSRPGIRLKLTEDSMSPAVCGLFRPVILLPQSLVDKLSAGQLRAVLLHEAIHLRRGDVWVNCAQALLQICYWWHPLLWLANARIRRVREEAVDDAVMLALRDDAEIYAPTLLEVAKLAFNRPLASLGLVGILESRSALQQRIERLMDFHAPRKAGLTVVSILGILTFSAVALPMGQAPEKTTPTLSGVNDNSNQTDSSIATAANLAGRIDDAQSLVTMTFAIKQPMKEARLKKLLLDADVKIPPTVCFYISDSGILLVRGTKQQLALVYRVVLKLNGVSSKGADKVVNDFAKEKNAMTGVSVSTTNLEMRVFKMDTNTFAARLQSFPGLQTNDVATMAKNLFSKFGVDFTATGRSVAYGDKLGLLFVRATPSELDTIERIVQALNQATPQIHIKARFIEVPKKGFVAMPQLFSNTVAGPMTGILSDPKFRTVLRALEQRQGVETLAEPECVTTSGRQTQMRATEKMNINVGFTPRGDSGNSTAAVPQVEKIEVGPVVDVIPYVLSDGYTINLKAIASVSEIVAYDKGTLAKPVIGSRQADATANLWDNQTLVLVLGNLKSYLADAAELKSNANDKEVILFLTATIVDPAGNRVHSDDELPFNPNTIPVQPKISNPSP